MKLQVLTTIFNDNHHHLTHQREGRPLTTERDGNFNSSVTVHYLQLRSGGDCFISDVTVNITGLLLTEALCGPCSAEARNLQSEQRVRRRPTASSSRGRSRCYHLATLL